MIFISLTIPCTTMRCTLKLIKNWMSLCNSRRTNICSHRESLPVPSWILVLFFIWLIHHNGAQIMLIFGTCGKYQNLWHHHEICLRLIKIHFTYSQETSPPIFSIHLPIMTWLCINKYYQRAILPWCRSWSSVLPISTFIHTTINPILWGEPLSQISNIMNWMWNPFQNYVKLAQIDKSPPSSPPQKIASDLKSCHSVTGIDPIARTISNASRGGFPQTHFL